MLIGQLDLRMGLVGWVFNPPSSFVSILVVDASSAREGVG